MDWGEPKERQIRAWGGEQTGSAGLVTLERGGSRDGRGEGEWAEMQDREGGREGVAGAAPPAQALEPPPPQGCPHLQLPCPHLLLPARCQWISLLWQGVSGHCGDTVRASPPPSRTTSPYPRHHCQVFICPPTQDLPPSCFFPKSPQGQCCGGSPTTPPFCFCLQPLT